MSGSNFSPIQWDNNQLQLIDQRLLPDQEVWLSYTTALDVARAIQQMVVRGAPAIGISAAYAVALACLQLRKSSQPDWQNTLQQDIKTLADSRPTAVNLFWALERMQKVLGSVDSKDAAFDIALQEAKQIHAEDVQMNKAIGEYGSSLLHEETRALTHCNTGALATGGHGTALGVIRTAWAKGLLSKVYVDETRPWLQGSRLTVWELMRDNIPCTLQADSAAALLMQHGKVDWVIVGADRIAANGDTANKIGTYALAVLAKAHGVKFMVAAPSSTLDHELSDGRQIPIEQREAEELWHSASRQKPPKGLDFYNPVFDVTPHHLIDAIVTEKGLVHRSKSDEFQVQLQAWKAN
ncbi:MAG: S-methyl-5-thioribose-1-phosphate isomerase [Gammaproteobacteria bacterium]|nr:S-methyl-5-thioribose-1-phosphate isomerase [Gammaproteobacteria bacterium]NNC98072.1 S-methyl-5-thioribose-1-phosphate isomerase [Gammaproteobacteria bacterium]NNM14622.1 S-methyl-5-thioribose-1-phosphate isomerase [Gammaproteobacteria bacterium]